MSEKEKAAAKLLDTRLSDKIAKKMCTCAVIMLIAVLIHDGDHIRQAYKWTYSIPLSLWALNLTVYVLPVVSIFLAKSKRFSATLVSAIAGVFTSASLSCTSAAHLPGFGACGTSHTSSSLKAYGITAYSIRG